MPPSEKRSETIGSIKTPLKLLALITMVVEATVLVIAYKTESDVRGLLLGLSLIILLFLVIAAMVIQWLKVSKINSHSGLEDLSSRSKYIYQYIHNIDSAHKEVMLLTSKMHISSHSDEAREVNQAVKRASQRGVCVHVLVAEAHDRISGVAELSGLPGILIRLDPTLHIADISFLITDQLNVVIAKRDPDANTKSYSKSYSWIEIQSSRLSAILREDFEKRWGAVATRGFQQYLEEVIPNLAKAGQTVELKKQFGVAEQLVHEVLTRSAKLVFLIGRPGSGKSTVGCIFKAIASECHIYPRGVELISDLDFFERVFQDDTLLNRRFERTSDNGFFIFDQSLYDEALASLSERVRLASLADVVLIEFSRKSYVAALEQLQRSGLVPSLIVYIEADFDTAMERNRIRPLRGTGDRHYVSAKEMRATFLEDDYVLLKRVHGNKLLTLSNSATMSLTLKGKASEIVERLKC